MTLRHPAEGVGEGLLALVDQARSVAKSISRLLRGPEALRWSGAGAVPFPAARRVTGSRRS